MAVNTNNAYGNISISDLAIAKVSSLAAKEAYGIVEIGKGCRIGKWWIPYHNIKDGRGVKVTTSGNRIYVDVYVVMKYGISIGAVAESVKEEVKYKVEVFTGMLVDVVNVHVIGVKQ